MHIYIHIIDECTQIYDTNYSINKLNLYYV